MKSFQWTVKYRIVVLSLVAAITAGGLTHLAWAQLSEAQQGPVPGVQDPAPTRHPFRYIRTRSERASAFADIAVLSGRAVPRIDGAPLAGLTLRGVSFAPSPTGTVDYVSLDFGGPDWEPWVDQPGRYAGPRAWVRAFSVDPRGLKMHDGAVPFDLGVPGARAYHELADGAGGYVVVTSEGRGYVVDVWNAPTLTRAGPDAEIVDFLRRLAALP